MDHLLSAESVIAEEGSFWGGFKPRCHGSQAPSLFYGYFGPSLTTALSFPIHIQLFFLFSITLLCLQLHAILQFHLCLLVRANLKTRLTEDGSSGLEKGRVCGGKRLLFVWTDAEGHLWTSVSDQRSQWCRTDSWVMSYQPLLWPSSIIQSPHPSHSDDGTLNKVN